MPVEEMVAKVEAAVRARWNSDFVIIARADSLTTAGGSVQDAVDRLGAYGAAGADVLLPLVY